MTSRRALSILVSLGIGALVLHGCAVSNESGRSVARSEERALAYLAREVPHWSLENGCYSCHNNGDGARALYVARRMGYTVRNESLDSTTRWLARPSGWPDNRGDPGFSDQRLANLQFAASATAALDAGALDPALLDAIAPLLIADQASDGSWPIEPHNPAGSPTTYGNALATAMALHVLRKSVVYADSGSVRLAEDYLRNFRSSSVVGVAAALLALPSEPRAEERLRFLLESQTSDGGWGPYRDAPAEAFDTALALLALAPRANEHVIAGVIGRGRAYLADTQLGDGSWPETTRPAGGISYAQRISTTAWATLALLETRLQ